MKKFYFLLCTFTNLFLCISASAQITFEKTYGAGVGNFVEQTSDSGYIVIGDSVTSPTSSVLHLLKTDAYGYTLWTKNYGGTGEYDNSLGYCIRQTTDGGYIAAAYVEIFGGYCIIKFDAAGDTVWTKSFGLSNGGVISIKQTTDGGYIGGGGKPGNGGDAALYKFDSNGNTQWIKAYGGTGADVGNYVDTTSDGGYIITGIYDQNGANNGDVYLIRTDANGDTLWTKTFGGTSYDVGNSVQQASDGGFIVIGRTELIKVDSAGNKQWSKPIYGYSIQQTNDGDYIIGSSDTSSNAYAYLIKTNNNGDTLWTRTFNYYGVDLFVQQTSDNGYVFTGGGPGGTIIYLVKTDASGYITGISENIPSNFPSANVYPTLATTFINIIIYNSVSINYKIILYDISGKEVKKYVIQNSETTVVINELHSGMYLFRIQNENGQVIRTGKILKQ